MFGIDDRLREAKASGLTDARSSVAAGLAWEAHRLEDAALCAHIVLESICKRAGREARLLQCCVRRLAALLEFKHLHCR